VYIKQVAEIDRQIADLQAKIAASTAVPNNHDNSKSHLVIENKAHASMRAHNVCYADNENKNTGISTQSLVYKPTPISKVATRTVQQTAVKPTNKDAKTRAPVDIKRTVPTSSSLRLVHIDLFKGGNVDDVSSSDVTEESPVKSKLRTAIGSQVIISR
jgi:hypothetical protein